MLPELATRLFVESHGYAIHKPFIKSFLQQTWFLLPGTSPLIMVN